MILAAYLVTGFLVASVYAVGMLRGRRDRYHRLGLLIPLTVAASWRRSSSWSATPPPARSPRTSRSSSPRWSACSTTHRDVTEYIGGRCTDDGVKGGIGIPGLDSFLVGFSTDTKVIGLDTVPAKDRPPANTLLHLGLRRHGRDRHRPDALGLWLGDRLVAQAATSRSRSGSCAPWPCRGWPRSWRSSAAGSSPRWAASRGSSTRSCGPRRRSPAPAGSGSHSRSCSSSTRRSAWRRCSSCARWRGAGARRSRRETTSPTGPRGRARGRPRGARMSTADAVAGVLWVGVDPLRGVRRRRLRRRVLVAGRRGRTSAASGRAS